MDSVVSWGQPECGRQGEDVPRILTSGCGPGADRCERARTHPEIVIHCEHHFLAAIQSQWAACEVDGGLDEPALLNQSMNGAAAFGA
jgi:hypothetical protein